MAKIFKPRRVKASSIAQGGSKANVVLANGEVVFVMPSTGSGTGIGGIIMGDGRTAISNLPYMINGNVSDGKVTVTTDISNNPISNVVSNKTLGDITGSLKASSIKNATTISNIDVTSLSNGFNGINSIVNKLSGYGATPVNNSPSAICDAILTGAVKWVSADVLNNDYTNAYNDDGRLIATFSSVNDTRNFIKSNVSTKGFNEKVKPGDKIQINDGTYNKEWIIVGFNTQNRATSQPHISLIPTDSLGDFVMNSTATNSGGYVGSEAFAICNNIANNLARVLGDYLLTRNELLGNSGYPSYTTTSKSVRVNLLNEMQIRGRREYSVDSEDGYDTTQLPGFIINYRYRRPYDRILCWLRSASKDSNDSFCIGYDYTLLSVNEANKIKNIDTYEIGFCPLITIGLPGGGSSNSNSTVHV